MTPSRFVALVKGLHPLPDVFNPWRDHDTENDTGLEAPAIRASNLERYLDMRQGKARFIFVGEAPGFRGAKFSGIAMTSERILLNKQSAVPADAVFFGDKIRTSNPRLFENGSIEPTASITWALLLSLGLKPDEFLFWNAFFAHPHLPGCPLTNRAPRPPELKAAAAALPAMLTMFPSAQVVAVGRVAQRTLQGLGVAAPDVRHPAMGGATKFRTQVQALLCP